MTSKCRQSQSSVSIGDSSSNITVVAIKSTKRNPIIWDSYDLCVLSLNSRMKCDARNVRFFKGRRKYIFEKSFKFVLQSREI